MRIRSGPRWLARRSGVLCSYRCKGGEPDEGGHRHTVSYRTRSCRASCLASCSSRTPVRGLRHQPEHGRVDPSPSGPSRTRSSKNVVAVSPCDVPLLGSRCLYLGGGRVIANNRLCRSRRGRRASGVSWHRCQVGACTPFGCLVERVGLPLRRPGRRGVVVAGLSCQCLSPARRPPGSSLLWRRPPGAVVVARLRSGASRPGLPVGGRWVGSPARPGRPQGRCGRAVQTFAPR